MNKKRLIGLIALISASGWGVARAAGVVNGQAVNATITNAAFLYKNGADSSPYAYLFGSIGAADPSSELEVRSTTLGFLLPRMTTAQQNAISSPAAGLIIFNTTSGLPSYYTGSAWTNSGDVSSNTSSSVDSEIALFSGTGGKTLKRATGTGVAHVTSGVLSASSIVNADVSGSAAIAIEKIQTTGAAGTGSVTPNTLSIIAGNGGPLSNAGGGSLSLGAGNATTTSSTGIGGSTSLYSGDGSSGGRTGDVVIQTGANSSTSAGVAATGQSILEFLGSAGATSTATSGTRTGQKSTNFEFLNGNGGDATGVGATSNTGGASGGFTWGGGETGGNASGATTNVGGAGGTVTLTGASGGAATTGTTATGGAGAGITLAAGAGGAASGATTNNGGNGGSVSITAGSAGTGSTANGTAGSITLTTAGTARETIGPTGTVTLSNLGTGVVHSSSVGLLTSSTVTNAETTATNANTASTIVARDGSGNFSAGTITAAITGNVTGALTGNASTATALAANPTDCGVGTKATAIDASGNLTCSAVSLTADVSGNLPVANLNSGTSASSTTFWRGDGTWATPPGTGTVTSVAATVPTFLSISGSPVTTSGTLAISLSGTALPVANGGTGITSGTSGGIPYYSGTSSIASSGALTANTLVLGGGAGSAPTSLGAGTTTTVLHGNASGAPTYAAVSMTADVTGTLPVANGGTGVTSSTGSGANVLGTSPALTTPTIAGSTMSGNNSLTGQIGWLQTATAGTITSAATYNDVAITGSYMKFTGLTGNVTLTGFDATSAVDGRRIVVQLVSADNSTGRTVTFANANVGSSANNRISTSTRADVTCTMTAISSNLFGCMAEFIYDTANGRWSLMWSRP